ncbi:MAG: phosphoadenylyl-sulfate reductase [Sediminibacterium sp.]
MPHNNINDALASLQHTIAGKTIPEALEALVAAYPDADQVVTDLIRQNKLPVSFFTLDTGRLFPETYSTWSRTTAYYNLTIKAYYPNTSQIETFVEANGPNAFYDSVELRTSCCFIRKVEPLKRALAGKAIWITGLRAEHSPARKNLEILEWDEANQLIKYHPLLHWTTEEVKQYIHERAIPYNPLHDNGFVSIGCAPCTRAIKPGEDFRAGRWWWEDSSKKECGLHVHQNNKEVTA